MYMYVLLCSLGLGVIVVYKILYDFDSQYFFLKKVSCSVLIKCVCISVAISMLHLPFSSFLYPLSHFSLLANLRILRKRPWSYFSDDLVDNLCSKFHQNQHVNVLRCCYLPPLVRRRSLLLHLI